MMKYPLILAVIFIFIFSCKDQERKQQHVEIISVEAAENQLNEDADFFLVDVRTPEEFAEGHIGGAVNIDYFDPDFKEEMDALSKDRPLYIYCRSGNRTQKAMPILKDLGFKTIYDIEGGYLNWERKNSQ